MPLERLLRRLALDAGYQEQITAWEEIPPRQAALAPLPADLLPDLRDKLSAVGIQSLYQHQLEVWETVWVNRQHCILTTSTASGKTLAYSLPVLNRLLTHPSATALFIFPTKALAHDQMNSLTSLLPLQDGPRRLSTAQVGIFDGDTPANRRSLIRQNARLLLTNPDMLHIGILPHHTRWADFFTGLSFVVIDEIHTYRGVFGSHVANVIRRLQRIARFYGANPIFLFTSATIANPAELAARMVGEPVKIISRDGSPSGKKHLLFYNPPVVEPELGLRRSIYQETLNFASLFFAEHLQTLIFARTRRSVEILLRLIREAPGTPDLPEQVRGYRSGYLPKERRAIESALRTGLARIVVATNALELGIDIGGLDVVLLAGYPGRIASTWQQAGRAGRKSGGESAVVMIFSANPLDQFIAFHPEFFFGRSPEKALINPDHLIILFEHIRCAAFEIPFRADESFGSLESSELSEILNLLTTEGTLHLSQDRYRWISDEFPAAKTSLRSASTERVLIQHQDHTIGETDRYSALWMLHPGAIYLHQGQSYRVQQLDLETNVANVVESEVDYYTEPKSEQTVNLITLHQQTAVPGGDKNLGDLQVTSQVTGYKKIQWGTGMPLGIGEVNLPPQVLNTSGYWISLNDNLVDQLRAEGVWLNDANAYGPGWEKIRAVVRARDSYHCQVCGAAETGEVFHVHHKIPFRAFPSPQEANRLENLVTLCPACHRRVEQNVRIRSGLSGLGYLLLNLAPLFLMCDQTDLGLQVEPRSAITGSPAVFLFETIPAGIGFCQELFGLHDRLINDAYEVTSQCGCKDGCPSCTGPGGENGRGSKVETLALLEGLKSFPSPGF
jgi:DEAD/DEAH box helicase domain-containing protein